MGEHRDMIVIGASAGGIEALKTLLAQVPATLPATIFIVVHLSAESPGLLAQILAYGSQLPVVQATDQAPIQQGYVYVAPPDQHLLLEAGRLRLTHGPKENRFRPAIDPLFRSAAAAFGPRVIGVVLSGMLDDGTAGLWAIKDRQGIAIVQAPSDALYPSMPQSALRYVAVDHQLPISDMAALLAELVHPPLVQEGASPVGERLVIETNIALADNGLRSGVLQLGMPSFYTCPECHGVLIQIEEGRLMRYRCHTGHAYSPETLLAELSKSVEDGLWNTVRTMDEQVLLLQQLTAQGRATQEPAYADQLHAEAARVLANAQLIREVAVQQPKRSQP